MGKKSSGEEFSSFIGNTSAYIPYAVIGIFIVLAATFTSAFLVNMDSEVAETIYTTEKSDPRQTAVNLAASDLARCLNYAGMEALEWQGEHPVIQPEGVPVEKLSEDGFMVNPQDQDLERGDVLKISVNMPSDVWGRVEALWKNMDVVLVVKDSKGNELERENYGQATGFLSKVSFDEYVEIPETAESGYASIELYYGNELKASDWFRVEVSPVKDITADGLNRLLAANYQGNMHTFMEFAVNVEPEIKPEEIKVRKVQGTLEREINPSEKNYTIYYIFEVPALNYTLVDLESGEVYNGSMNLSTLVTSREPLLEELVREYETELKNSASPDSTSNLVLGAMNLRTFIYGPWQYYAKGPLNILTNPALASSVNGATIYTQKKVFDSVDPLALTYTTYYNGKVLYEDALASRDVKQDSEGLESDSGSGSGSGSGLNSTNSSVSKDRYELDKGVNLTTTYDSLSQDKSFNLDVEEGIDESLKEANTSFEELSEYSEIKVSASDYTEGVLDGWVFNDHVWTDENPDLIHDVTDSVYMAPVQGQVIRDGFCSPDPLVSAIAADFDRSSVSYSGHTVNWASDYLASGTHAGSLVPSYAWSDSTTNSYSETMSPSIRPPRGHVSSWSITGASVSLKSVEITDVKVVPHYEYRANDRLIAENRTDGYLDLEDHVFDWGIRYDISYAIKTSWKIDYNYLYTYIWHTAVPNPNGGHTIVSHSGTSSGSDSETTSKTDSEFLFHTETESENLTIIFHKRPPTGGYTGLSTYADPTEREYRETTVYADGADRFDPCCSDAADKYRDAHVDLRAIESMFWAYPDGQYLAEHSVPCDIPPWLHRVMAEEVLAMLSEIEEDNPTFSYSLLENPGQDPTDLQVETAEKLVLDLEASRKNYVNRKQHLTHTGEMYSSSDSARYTARNEAYNKLLEDIEQKNKKLDSNLDSYILEALDKKGLDTGMLDDVTSGTLTLFNNPAMERAASALGAEMGIISTMTVTGQPESKYSWDENLTLIIDQKPNYLYHDPDFDLRGEYEWTDPMTGKTIYPLGVRNTCIFTTGLSEEIADAIATSGEYVKTETAEQISRSIAVLNEEVLLLEENLSEQSVSLDTSSLDLEVYNLKRIYAKEMKVRVTKEIAAEVSSNPGISDWISEARVRTITFGYLSSLSDDKIIEKSTTEELSEELATIIKTEIRNSNPTIGPDELEAVLNRVDTDVRIGVADGICAVTVNKGEVLDACFGKIDDELKNLADETVDRYSGEAGDLVSKRLDRVMAAVPCGLPVLPPHWVFTVNVWTYEVVGKYQVFTVIDNDNEVIPKPYFGHKGQRYVRQDERVKHPCNQNNDGTPIIIGENLPIKYRFSGYASTIVGPGPKGVGDKVGSSTEKSVGYDSLILEIGGNP
ncbi:hypothetical protein FTO70_14565 [Methanosarcina sp. KYL-1]|uniref:DUF7286 family protein n=1 Tax=Methanosarcina sp. KYL-1 TaxID=2602068 RepID=UPI0021016BF1|nr:hypothetical protein [Methanosarcina sp. KYL-1]MCQ1536871.1 hypothetical protein [Methanosarcina sp. KYL-1]